jgi:uncharacterized protein (TIGR00255 family)
VAVTVEIRTVNNRYLKLTLRMSEGYGSLEPQLEALLRQHLRRGTFTVYAQITRDASPDDYRLNEAVLASYRQQLETLQRAAGLTEPVRLESLLALPGAVLEGASHHAAAEADWPLLERTTLTALENLARMRRAEGEAMLADLRANCQVIAANLEQIQLRAPRVVDSYRDRLLERLNRLLQDYEVRLGADDVVREVAILADRSDISEELTRLRSHLEQFDTLADGPESNGRKLEFLIQEMFREANTIGSKANDVDI